jgi:bifunctional glutamyl/prolyl-tRNA synthetase
LLIILNQRFLHVGHAKAALLNKFYKDEYKGKMIFRFDDTNPAKENHEYEQAILEDVKTLGCDYDQFTRTSDHFDKLLECCEQLIKSGKGYADDTDAEKMKIERDQQVESKNRNNSKF